jgi:tripartite-type tricarboxylate transporter receptor subunit TctC
LALATGGGSAVAVEAFPNQVVTLVVGFAPGGGIDVIARLFAARLAEALGHPVIVENRPGAGSRIANDYVTRSKPDGHTLLVTAAATVIDMEISGKHGEGLRAFAPVSTIANGPMILVVRAASPAWTLDELVARARAAPGRLNYSSSGPGTTVHLYGELFKLRTGVDIVHVPYKGTAPALAALLAGDVDLTFAPVVAVVPHVKAGQLRALATTGARRAALLPDVPTMTEAGTRGVEATVWYGLLAPAGTPAAVVDTLARAVADATRSPEFRRRLLDLGLEPEASAPEAFTQLLRDEVVKWSDVVKTAGVHAE